MQLSNILLHKSLSITISIAQQLGFYVTGHAQMKTMGIPTM